MVNITEVYNRFFALGGCPPTSIKPWQFRRKVTSMRLPGCLLLAELVRTRRPARVLDLGSGITTLVLRELQKEFPSMLVVTTDTSTRWLETTQLELVRDRLREDHCYTQDTFATQTWEPFDLVSVDCDNLEYRLTLAPSLAAWCAPRGVLVFDDWAMRDYALRMTVCMTALGFVVTERPDTLDEFNQILALAERP